MGDKTSLRGCIHSLGVDGVVGCVMEGRVACLRPGVAG